MHIGAKARKSVPSGNSKSFCMMDQSVRAGADESTNSRMKVVFRTKEFAIFPKNHRTK